MEKLTELWGKITAKIGVDAALAVAAGLVAGIFVHPVVGIVVGGGFYLYKTGKLQGWLSKE